MRRALRLPYSAIDQELFTRSDGASPEHRRVLGTREAMGCVSYWVGDDRARGDLVRLFHNRGGSFQHGLDEFRRRELLAEWLKQQIDFGFFQGRADAFVPMVMAHEREAVKRWHLVTGVMIRLDGDRAEAESYGITTGMMARNAPRRMYGGRYLDEFQRRKGEWRLSKRVYLLDWSKTYTDEAESALITGGALNIPDIAAPGHPLYRPM